MNMIGETNEERAGINSNLKESKEEAFLSELAKHVNKSENLPNNPQHKAGMSLYVYVSNYYYFLLFVCQ